jgi:DNA-binding NtrC family response regulator
MKTKTAILIVDDEEIALQAIKKELMYDFGGAYLLETSRDSREAIDLIDELCAEGIRVILIISDWLMPGLKGDEFLARVKSKHPEVRCIIISGQADQASIERARSMVALDAFLQKPWRHEDLIAAVEACLALTR